MKKIRVQAKGTIESESVVTADITAGLDRDFIDDVDAAGAAATILDEAGWMEDEEGPVELAFSHA